MRGHTAAEQRAEQLQSVTSLGLLADDVALATIRYPTLGVNERSALTRLSKLLEAFENPGSPTRAFPRRKSMSDPIAILVQAAAAVHQSGESGAQHALDLGWLRTPVTELLQTRADKSAVKSVRAFAETLAHVTLRLAEELANEKGVDDWTLKVSDFSTA